MYIEIEIQENKTQLLQYAHYALHVTSGNWSNIYQTDNDLVIQLDTPNNQKAFETLSKYNKLSIRWVDSITGKQVKRVRTKLNSQNNKARRYARRHNISTIDALELYDSYKPKQYNNIFWIRSTSTRRYYPLVLV